MLWAGQPARQVIFHPSDWYAIPFSLLWGGFAIFWEWGATGHFANSKDSPSIFMTLWGIPFIVMGQYMIWGRFLYTAWKKGRTHYAVTTKRVLVVTSGATRKVVSGYLRTLDSVTLTTRQDGSGTVEFSPGSQSPSLLSGTQGVAEEDRSWTSIFRGWRSTMSRTYGACTG